MEKFTALSDKIDEVKEDHSRRVEDVQEELLRLIREK